jgi:hypothetical protein
MNRRFPVTSSLAVMAGVTAICAAVALAPFSGRAGRASERPAAQRPLPQPVVDTHQLMELFNKPLYEFMREALSQQPTDEKGWQTVRERGLQAAEVMNLVAIREQATEHKEWKQLAAATQRAGLQLAEAGRNQDWQAATGAYRSIIASCNNCHQRVAPDQAPQLKP